ncbi:MAG: fasciclin domain-containing protein [Planctomycetes bacterium]|nr:fasciclin domain-containing protein [Planctomycetota bacterium]
MAQDKPHEKPAPEKKDQEHKNGKKEATEGAKEKAKEAVKTEKDIVETATADKDLATFCELLKDADLVEKLKGEGPFTVFAPTNAAFEKLGNETLDNLKKDKAKLASVLKYHVHAGKLAAADVEKAKTIKTLNGAELTVTVKEKEVTIDKSKVTKTDIKCKNGVIHLIDAVAMPAEKKPEAKPKG